MICEYCKRTLHETNGVLWDDRNFDRCDDSPSDLHQPPDPDIPHYPPVQLA